MTPESILLSIRERSGEGSYRFSCPTCLHTIEKPADRKVAALLLSAGVEVADGAQRVTYHGYACHGGTIRLRLVLVDGTIVDRAARTHPERPGSAVCIAEFTEPLPFTVSSREFVPGRH